MPEITVKTAERIISLHAALADCRKKLKVLQGAASVTVTVNCENGQGYDRRREEIRIAGSLDDQRRRSAVALVRQTYEALEARCIRELRLLGAEVPNG